MDRQALETVRPSRKVARSLSPSRCSGSSVHKRPRANGRGSESSSSAWLRCGVQKHRSSRKGVLVNRPTAVGSRTGTIIRRQRLGRLQGFPVPRHYCVRPKLLDVGVAGRLWSENITSGPMRSIALSNASADRPSSQAVTILTANNGWRRPISWPDTKPGHEFVRAKAEVAIRPSSPVRRLPSGRQRLKPSRIPTGRRRPKPAGSTFCGVQGVRKLRSILAPTDFAAPW